MRLNGIGTMWLGATNRRANQVEATLWFTFLFAPILPLRRARLALLPHQGDGFSLRELEATPLAFGEILKTYLFSLVAVPVIVAAPAVPAIEEVRVRLGMPESWQTPWIFVAIAWLGLCTWKLMNWHQNRYHPR